MPRSTIIIFVIWSLLVLLSMTDLGVFLGLIFGFVVAMFVFPIGMMIEQMLPSLSQAYSDAVGPHYALLLPVWALLTLGLILAVWGFLKYNNSGRGTALMNLGTSLTGIFSVVLVSNSALANSGFGN